MKNCRILSAILVVIMLFALIPAAAFAEGIGNLASEAASMGKLNNTWKALDAAEKAARANGASKMETINAVYAEALNLGLVDSDSFSDFNKDGFLFTVDGMYNAYNYRLRNELEKNVVSEGAVTVIPGSGKDIDLKDATSPDVLLIGPYYGGYDLSFTDQYSNEAASIAGATGGTVTILEGHAATGPAIAEAYVNKGVVIYDSHGIATSSSSYLCLTTNQGCTSEDYQNGWAINMGGAAYIDGRYIENHISEPAANTFVWMAICEGMKKSGNGVTGAALLRAGCEVVYGYSQSVTFAGDYVYEETFWEVMKEEGSVDEAYKIMVDTWGECDPYGDAYPIVMSAVDSFPANPDAPQTVHVDYTIFGNAEPTALESFRLAETSVTMDLGTEATVEIVREPENANLYEAIWETSNPNVVAIEKGNNRKGVLLATGKGRATITCTIMEGGNIFGSATVDVTVNADQELAASLNVEGGQLYFGTGAEKPFIVAESDGRVFAQSGNYHQVSSKSKLNLSIPMAAGDTLTFDYRINSQPDKDLFKLYVNDEVVFSDSGLKDWSTYTFTAEADGFYTFVWEYSKDSSQSHGDDCLKVDNVAFSGTVVPPEPSIEPDGDVDGDGQVSVSDATIVARNALGLVEFTEEESLHGDVDQDGEIAVSDAVTIMRMALGL